MEPGFREIYVRCAPAAFRRAFLLLRDEHDAWDVVHDVFAKLAQERGWARIRARPMTYVWRATTNRCLNVLEARRLRATSIVPADDEPRAHSEAIHARDLLEKLAPELDDVDRQILVLQFVDGLSQDEIAETLNLWRRTVGRRLARLRARLIELGWEEGGRS